MLKVNCNTFYPNKTNRFVAPALADWGDEFLTILNTITPFIRGIGINDQKYYNFIGKYLFICVKPFSNLQDVLEIFRQHRAYEHDYYRDKSHILVTKLPSEHKDVLLRFVLGKYSKMYDSDSIDRLFPKTFIKGRTEIINNTYRILKKDITYAPIFQEKLKELYGATIYPSVDEILEYEVPPNLEDEIFDYNYASELAAEERKPCMV